MALKVHIMSHSFVLLNVYLCCNDASHVSLHEIQSNLLDISNFINDELLDDIFISGDFNADPFKGWFFNIFESQMLDYSRSFCDVIQFPASFFTFMTRNSSALTSWLDHIVCSNPRVFSQIIKTYMVTHNMITSLYTVSLVSRVLTQKLTYRIKSLRSITLNGIKSLMTKNRYTVITLMT